MRVSGIADSIAPKARREIIGIRPGEKLHEQMIGAEDAPYTYEYKTHYKILPAIHSWSKDPNRIDNGQLVSSDFIYSSDINSEWMTVDYLRNWVKENQKKIGNI
jgi:FlaA1/EpsC-like NDP-sugar epimerase